MGKEYQLEFSFVKKMNRNWFSEHFVPNFGWDVKPDEIVADDDNGNFWEMVKKHLRIGFAFKWKF